VFMVGTDSDVGSLHHVDVGSAADITEEYAASIFRMKVIRVRRCSCMSRFWSNRPRVGRAGGPIGTVDREML
jgi:hypothetical protein